MTSPDDRRMTALELRLDAIDQHGTRGLEGMRAQVGVLQRDVGKVESGVDRMETTLQAMQLTLAQIRPRNPWPTFIAYCGIMTPMYALVIDLITHNH